METLQQHFLDQPLSKDNGILQNATFSAIVRMVLAVSRDVFLYFCFCLCSTDLKWVGISSENVTSLCTTFNLTRFKSESDDSWGVVCLYCQYCQSNMPGALTFWSLHWLPGSFVVMQVFTRQLLYILNKHIIYIYITCYFLSFRGAGRQICYF